MDSSVTLTMVTVMLGLDVMRSLLDEARRVASELTVLKLMADFAHGFGSMCGYQFASRT